MTINPMITDRDLTLFHDISRFGFTTTEHYKLRFNTSLIQARKRFHKLTKGLYLKRYAVSSATKRRIYIPDYWFYKVLPYRNVYKINSYQIAHDEYLLKLYSVLKRDNLGKTIEIEQDFKKAGTSKQYSRVPDLLLHIEDGKFIFEYEKSIKNESKYDSMASIYSSYSRKDFYFVFICETQEIAVKLRKKCGNLKYVAFIKPEPFLKALDAKTYKTLPKLLISQVSYFPSEEKEPGQQEEHIQGANREQTGNTEK